MLTAGLGVGLAEALGVAPAYAEAESPSLSFGSLEPLVALIQETPPDALQPLLVERLRTGTVLRQLVAAGALANARTFGGEDYIGFHAFMALSPALAMSRELPTEQRALPVLKVLYRTSAQIQALGGAKNQVLHPVEHPELSAQATTPDHLRETARARDMDAAERTFAGIVQKSPKEAYDALQALVQEELDVHRVVLAYRAWGMQDITGKEHAHTLLRQSVRYCVGVERQRVARGYPEPAIRTIVPRVLDQFHLLSPPPSTRQVDDAWVDRLCMTILASTPDQAADAVAGALAEGIDPKAVGEALTLAANQQVLRDAGRTAGQVSPGKPLGSVHGDSVGVHASDSVNAWRNIAAVSNQRNAVVSLIAAAAHIARSGRDAARQPYPWAEHLEAVQEKDPARLLQQVDDAIRQQDQTRTCALVQRYGDLGHPTQPVFNMLLKYATSEDGSLHAEKFYRTVREEHGRGRKTFRLRHLVALARVTASEYGRPAPGYEDACRLLKG
jgi:hypothetical protein